MRCALSYREVVLCSNESKPFQLLDGCLPSDCGEAGRLWLTATMHCSARVPIRSFLPRSSRSRHACLSGSGESSCHGGELHERYTNYVKIRRRPLPSVAYCCKRGLRCTRSCSASQLAGLSADILLDRRTFSDACITALFGSLAMIRRPLPFPLLLGSAQQFSPSNNTICKPLPHSSSPCGSAKLDFSFSTLIFILLRLVMQIPVLFPRFTPLASGDKSEMRRRKEGPRPYSRQGQGC